MKNRPLAKLLFTLSALLPFQASASIEIAENISTQSDRPLSLDRVSVTYLGTYEGPSVGSPSGQLPDEYGNFLDENGAPIGKQKLTNQLYLFYRITKDIQGGLGLNSEYVPIGGQEFVWRDPMIYVKFKNIVRDDQLRINVDLRTYLPVSDESKLRKIKARVGSQQNFYYRFKGSRISLGAQTSLKWSILDSSAVKSNDLGFYFGPTFGYRISPSLSALITYEAGAKHKFKKALTDWTRDGTDLLLGAEYSFNESIVIYPYLKLMTGGKVSADSTTLGAQVNAKIL